MATLTVRDAARRLGVKPGKVRLLISERKLTARTESPVAGRRARVLLDADEVETLAQMRTRKRRARAGLAGMAAPSLAPDAAADDDAPQTTSLTGDVESAAMSFDAAGRRMVALVQVMVAPLATELRDARETIRCQAEELGALRATVRDLEQRLTAAATRPAPAQQALPDPQVMAPEAQWALRPGAVLSRRRLPLWRRVLVNLLG